MTILTGCTGVPLGTQNQERWSACSYGMNTSPKSASATSTGGALDTPVVSNPGARSEAARALARWRSGKAQKPADKTTIWTGRVFGKRAFVGQPVLLDGEVCWIKQVQRGWACVRTS